MSLERLVRDSLHEHVGQATPPSFDREAVRRSGQRHLRRRRVGTAVAMAASVAVVATIAVQVGDDTPRGDDSVPVTPGLVRAPVGGLRAFIAYDPAAGTEDLHVGGVVVHPDHSADSLDTTASTSPYGIFDIGTDGAPYLVTPDGDEVLLGDPTDPDGTGFRASIASDPEQPLAAWSAQSDAGVGLHLYALEAGREVASTDVPCDLDSGCGVEVVATAGGLVFVQTSDGTSVWDPDHGDALAPLTGPESPVIDVGGHVVLLDGSGGRGPLPDESDGPLAGGSWRFAWSNAVDDQLSGNGLWRLGYGSGSDRTVSRLLEDGTAELVDTITNTTNAAFDSDSSLLAVVNHGGGDYWLMDCTPPGGCTDVYRSEVGYEPMLLGNDE